METITDRHRDFDKFNMARPSGSDGCFDGFAFLRKVMNNIGKKVIVRGDRSGVFFGTLAERNGREVRLTNCRRLWYWDGAASNFQLASEGVKRPEKCKFTMTIEEIEILDAIEILPCTDKAVKNIEEVIPWKR